MSDRSFLEKFAINSAGEVILRKSLDYETQDSYFYQVMVTDGQTVRPFLPKKLFSIKLKGFVIMFLVA